MVVFKSVQAAIREGFVIVDFDREYRLFVCEKDLRRKSRLAKMIAFALPPKDTL